MSSYFRDITLGLVAVFAGTLGCTGSADALLVQGPGGSLTFAESGFPLAVTSVLYASTGSLQTGMSTPVAISEPGDTTESAARYRWSR
jgi:hypothetical protein